MSNVNQRFDVIKQLIEKKQFKITDDFDQYQQKKTKLIIKMIFTEYFDELNCVFELDLKQIKL